MKPIDKLLLFIFFLFLIFQTTSAQCDLGLITIEECDMENVDFDMDGTPDGVINLYAETGTTPADGVWNIDPRFSVAFDISTGNLSTWALKNSTTILTQNDYFFELKNATCGDVPFRTARLILGPYSGVALPPSGPLNINAQGCDEGGFNLFNAFLINSTIPSPHLNGEWTYNGSSPSFIGISGSQLNVEIPYQPGLPLVDQEVFELTYTVEGVLGCSTPQQTTVRIAMVRQVDSGTSKFIQICEDDMLAGVYDADINLRDDVYLEGEDIEGTWLSEPTGEIENENDSMINLRTIYDNLIDGGNNLRFGFQRYDFEYAVAQRSAVCVDQKSTVSFAFYEELRPFNQSGPFQICNNEISGESIDLFDLLEFTTENGQPFVYDSDVHTNWRQISGSSNVELVELLRPNPKVPEKLYSHRGNINVFGAIPGTYIFEFGVSPRINSSALGDSVCDPLQTDPLLPLYCEHPCDVLTARVEIQIFEPDYPGEDTMINVCESIGQVNLRSLLDTDGTPIANTGVWTNSAGAVINNTFVFPISDVAQTFNFTYTTVSTGGCTETADLALTINKLPNAGEDGGTTVCSDNLTVTLFDLLGGTPDTTGTWAGPFGYVSPDHLGVFDASDVFLPVLGAGEYIYMIPDNAGCSTSDQSKVVVTIVDPVEIGNDRSETFCKIDGRVNLYSLLDRDTPRTGVFEDTDNTGALSADGVLEFATLTSAIYNFRYVVRNAAPCDESSLNVSVQIIDLPIPNVPAQEFCILDAVRLEDIEVDVLNYNWYATQESETPIIDNPILLDNQVYYIATVDVDNCESERLEVMITILNTGERSSTGELCTLDFQDGVSPNGDGQNDTFDLLIEEVYNIPEAFPDFDIKIFNRYGSLVYEGNNNTEEFRGESNVSVRLGDDLPSGTYFYIFSPNFENNIPIQGSFYLSR
ncbi:gliding motility-associated C-terminal domain-containing protein [Aquimarina algiphila]|uniref:gliding motility-associated C-terminal domain-containing protein n=1 Tax=Aquimarina algiphila TaxID=2047982 RepID=UPI00232E4E2E|nr:gliding motility-associated C-terminal domain-containing protein [Aquimarina algiphila]